MLCTYARAAVFVDDEVHADQVYRSSRSDLAAAASAKREELLNAGLGGRAAELERWRTVRP